MTPSPSQKQELRPSCMILPPDQRSDDELVQLLLELYARSGMYPRSKELHDAWVCAKIEVMRRLQNRRPSPSAPVEEAVKEIEIEIRHYSELCNRKEEGLKLALDIIRRHTQDTHE